MLSLLSPTALLIALAMLAGSYAGGRFQQWRSDEKAQTQTLLKATQEAKRIENELSVNISEIYVQKNAEIEHITSERDAALAGLRNRVRERLPQTPSNCAGASPAALSAEDAGVAIRLASEADELRSSYIACKAYVEKLTAK